MSDDLTEPEDAGADEHPDNLAELLEIHEWLEATGEIEVPEGADGVAVEL